MLRLIYFVYFIKFSDKRIDDLYKRIVVRFTNHALYWFYSVTGVFTSGRTLTGRKSSDVIVSLTSYPGRINTLWFVIETLLNQSVKPARIILWLYRGEFDGEKKIPDKLNSLKSRGLEIRFCDENLLPHKKYFYVMQEFPDNRVITVDDDMLYHPDMVKNLLLYYEKYPDAVCCSILRKVKIENFEVRPYSEWEYVQDVTEPSYRNHLMGGGGTLFPPGSLHHELFNVKAIKELALRTDDLWLKIMSLKKNTKVGSTAGYYNRFFIPVIQKNDNPLMVLNIGNNNNDKNIRKLMDYYDIDYKWFID